MYPLTLVLSWQLAGPVAELDSHPMFLDTLGGQAHLTGFATRGACMAYRCSMPVSLNGTPQPYTVTSRSCHFASHGAGAGDVEEPVQ